MKTSQPKTYITEGPMIVIHPKGTFITEGSTTTEMQPRDIQVVIELGDDEFDHKDYPETTVSINELVAAWGAQKGVKVKTGE